MIETHALRLTKLMKILTVIGITVTIVMLLGCIGGYETNRMTTEQFFTYIFRVISAVLISSVIYAILDKFQKYTENVIHEKIERKRKIRRIKKLQKIFNFLLIYDDKNDIINKQTYVFDVLRTSGENLNKKFNLTILQH